VNKITPIPTHVAIIMDGNGRWLAARSPRIAGHKAGTDNVRRVVESFNNYGVKYLTLFAFSTENWRRPDEEVSGLFRILAEMIDARPGLCTRRMPDCAIWQNRFAGQIAAGKGAQSD